MDNVDVVLGYPWLDSIGTININVDFFFLKLWYKKEKITLQYISLVLKHEESMMMYEEASTKKLDGVPTNTLDEESMVELEEKAIEEHEEMP